MTRRRVAGVAAHRWDSESEKRQQGEEEVQERRMRGVVGGRTERTATRRV